MKLNELHEDFSEQLKPGDRVKIKEPYRNYGKKGTVKSVQKGNSTFAFSFGFGRSSDTVVVKLDNGDVVRMATSTMKKIVRPDPQGEIT